MTTTTTTPTSGAADLPEALRSIQRFEVVDCIDDKHVPAVIPKPHGPWVRYEDHIAALAAGQATAAVPPNAITAAIVRDDGGEAPAFCLMAAYRSEKDAIDAFALIAAAPAQPAAQQGVAYAALPEGWPARFRCDSCDGDGEVGEPMCHGYFQPPERARCQDCEGKGWCSEEAAFSADDMRAFADATHTLRASHGQASSQAGEYPALVCDYCGALTPDPWHSSGMLHGKMSKHIHSCDACASHGQAPASVLHLVNSAFAEIAMAFPKAFALHQVGIADKAVLEALAAPAPPPECETEAEKRAFAFGWFKALESERMKADNKKKDPL